MSLLLRILTLIVVLALTPFASSQPASALTIPGPQKPQIYTDLDTANIGTTKQFRVFVAGTSSTSAAVIPGPDPIPAPDPSPSGTITVSYWSVAQLGAWCGSGDTALVTSKTLTQTTNARSYALVDLPVPASATPGDLFFCISYRSTSLAYDHVANLVIADGKLVYETTGTAFVGSTPTISDRSIYANDTVYVKTALQAKTDASKKASNLAAGNDLHVTLVATGTTASVPVVSAEVPATGITTVSFPAKNFPSGTLRIAYFRSSGGDFSDHIIEVPFTKSNLNRLSGSLVTTVKDSKGKVLTGAEASKIYNDDTVTFAATFAAGTAGVPTGNARLLRGVTLISSIAFPVTSGKGNVSYSGSNLGTWTGAQQIDVEYMTDATFVGHRVAGGTFTRITTDRPEPPVQVKPVVTITASDTTVTSGTVVKMTVTATHAGVSTPAGPVTLWANATGTCSGASAATGDATHAGTGIAKATIDFKAPIEPGTVKFCARIIPTNNTIFAPNEGTSAAAGNLVVTAPTTVALTTPEVIEKGQALSFKAGVLQDGRIVASPTGEVTIRGRSNPDAAWVEVAVLNVIEAPVTEGTQERYSTATLGLSWQHLVDVGLINLQLGNKPQFQALYAGDALHAKSNSTVGHVTINDIVVPPPPPPPPIKQSGYWMLGEDGTVWGFGAARLATPVDDQGRVINGSAVTMAGKAIDLEPTPDGRGYWIVSEFGDIEPKGAAPYFGDVLDIPGILDWINGERVVSISATPSGGGYWLFTNWGRVIEFGDAGFFGEVDFDLNGPILDSIATPSGKGYYLVASDGGVFAYGDAQFYGSMGDKHLNAPVQSLVPDLNGKGYWLVASDGGIFAFGAETQFFGSMGGERLNKPVTGMVAFGSAGYMMVAEDGGTFAFGTADFHGSLGDRRLNTTVVAIAIMYRAI